MQTTRDFNPSILRAYDIRGIVDVSIDKNDAYFIGEAFATYVIRHHEPDKTKPQKPRTPLKICVAFDGRLSSPLFEEFLVSGMKRTGVEIIRVGRGPTPMLYFAVNHLNADAGIMVTGSHNPKNHNGFKMLFDKLPLSEAAIKKLAVYAIHGDFVKGAGSCCFENVFDDYVQHLVQKLEPAKKSLKIAWDAGNGASGPAMAKLIKSLPHESILLNETIDGNFPAHHPDPSVSENMEQLKNTVIDNGCDLGIAFDGDGDRIGVIDSKGRILMGDQLLLLLAQDVLKQNPGAIVIADVKSSKVLFDEVTKNGGSAVMWKTGNSLIKRKMAEIGASIAGEVSGHIFYQDNNGFDDGLYAAVKLINILSNSGLSLADMYDSIPKTYSTEETKIEVEEVDKFTIIDKLKQNLNKKGQNFNDIDGVRVDSKIGWWLLRASNTSAAIISRCEAFTETDLKIVQAELVKNMEEAMGKVRSTYINVTRAV